MRPVPVMPPHPTRIALRSWECFARGAVSAVNLMGERGRDLFRKCRSVREKSDAELTLLSELGWRVIRASAFCDFRSRGPIPPVKPSRFHMSEPPQSILWCWSLTLSESRIDKRSHFWAEMVGRPATPRDLSPAFHERTPSRARTPRCTPTIEHDERACVEPLELPTNQPGLHARDRGLACTRRQ